ncbi:MAG: DUF86 domain-containing protein [Chloroflexota bacterium]|nr:MAG: DUF86 domain-containing protein [Chloroflexota bacterium]
MKDHLIYFRQILEAINRIVEYTAEGESAFLADRRTQDAVSRNIQIIGQAASRVPTDERSRHPDIPWLAIIGMRNAIVHEYDSVQLDLVWGVIERNLPELLAGIRQALQQDGGDSHGQA